MPPTGFKRSRALWDNARRDDISPGQQRLAFLRALLYELQPIRSSEIDTLQWVRGIKRSFLRLVDFLTQTIPAATKFLLSVMANMTVRQWMMVGGAVIYYYGVKYIHEMLDAGPLVVIVTALTAIFTFGLDDSGKRDGLSAYSMFNRGFQRILGDVDADALLAQHIGGGMAAFMPPNEPDVDHGQDPRQPEPQVLNDNDNIEHEPRHGAARRTGKKARRRNLEQRREMRRQREAAIGMGFGVDEERDVVAMHRLLDDQAIDD